MGKNRSGPSTGIRPRLFYGYVIVTACLVINLCLWGVFFSVGLFFKPMLNDFGWSRAITSGPISVSWVVGGALGITAGGLNDRFGPRLLVMIGGLLFGLGCILMSQIHDTWQIYVYYGLLVGAGLGLPVPLMSTVSRWFVKRRTVMTGVLMTGSGFGGIIMPPIANWLILSYGWRISYMVLGGIFLVVVLVSSQFLKRDPSQIDQMPYGADNSEAEKFKAKAKAISVRDALNTHQFWLMLLLFFCFSLSANTIMVHLVPHVTDLGIFPTVAATILVSTNAAGIIGRVGLGGLGDRLGNRRLFLIIFIFLAVALFGFIFVRELWLLYLFAIIFGLGYGAGLTQQSPIVANMFGLSSHGLILGALGIGHTLGAAVGTLFGGYFYDIGGGYQLMFMICGIASIIGLASDIAIKPVKAYDR